MLKKLFILFLFATAITMNASCTQPEQSSPVSEEQNSDAQAVLNCIMTRTSVRAYQDKAIEAEKIDKMLRAAMAAPTAVNRQPWHFIVIDDRAVLKELDASSPRPGMLSSAPLAIAVCGDMDKALTGGGRDFWIEDCSAATENLLLAAHALGLGAVWTGAYPAQERCDVMRKVLNIPENLIPLSLVVIGYPAGDQQPKDKYKPENISYNKFE